MHVSSLFVTLMGMGVTFIGLSAIIFLTWLLGKILGRMPEQTDAKSAPAPVPAAPAVPADGLTDEVRIAILAALAQEPGLRLEGANVTIRKV